MNNTLTPRTDKVVASDMGDSGFLVDMINHARQLERELNEAKLWIEKSNTVQHVMQVEAERDTLRKDNALLMQQLIIREVRKTK